MNSREWTRLGGRRLVETLVPSNDRFKPWKLVVLKVVELTSKENYTVALALKRVSAPSVAACRFRAFPPSGLKGNPCLEGLDTTDEWLSTSCLRYEVYFIHSR